MRRTALMWLAHPVTVLATVLLIVNDHVLKAAFPGLLTGKLSDVAGLVVTPPLVALGLALVAPRLRSSTGAAVAVGVVTVGFVAVKALPVVAAWASAGWSSVNGPSVVLADPTDLFTVPAGAIACLTWRAARDRPAPRRWLRLAAVLVVLPTVALAVAATSAPTYDDAVTATPWNGGIVVGVGNAYFKEDRRAVRGMKTVDGGATFFSTALADTLPDAPPVTSGCSTLLPRHCFRVVPGHLRVEESNDAGTSWRVAWQVDDHARARLAERFTDLGSAVEYLSSRALAVLDVPTGGVVVLVADGRDGFARRDASGHWARIGFGDTGYSFDKTPVAIPPATPGTVARTLPVQLGIALIVGAGVLFLCCAVVGLRTGRRWPVVTAAVWLMGSGVVVVAARAAGANNGLIAWACWLLGSGGLAVVAVITLAVLLGDGALASRGGPPIVLAAAASGGLVAAVLIVQATTDRFPFGAAVVAVTALVALALVGSALLGVRFARVPALVAAVPTASVHDLPPSRADAPSTAAAVLPIRPAAPGPPD